MSKKIFLFTEIQKYTRDMSHRTAFSTLKRAQDFGAALAAHYFYHEGADIPLEWTAYENGEWYCEPTNTVGLRINEISLDNDDTSALHNTPYCYGA